MSQAHDRSAPGWFERQVGVARRENDAIGVKLHSILADKRLALCDHTQLPREHRHERLRKMLCDKNRHADAQRQLMKQDAERMDAAGRSADREQVDRVAWHRSQQISTSQRLGADWRKDRRRRITKRLQLAEQDFREFPVEAAGSRLGQRVGSSERQGRDGLLSALLRKRGDDHHLCSRGGGDDSRHRLQAPGARHLQVEQDDVDPDMGQRFDRVFRGSCDGRNLERRVAFDHSRQHRPGNRRIVDDHQPYATACGARIRKAVPRSGERPLHVARLRLRRRAAA